MKKRITALLLCLCMIATLFPQTVFAAGNAKAIQLGSSVLQENVNTTTAATVYFAKDGYNKPFAWRIIGYDGQGAVTSSGSITLLAKDNVAKNIFRNSYTEADYEGSVLQQEMNSVEACMNPSGSEGLYERLAFQNCLTSRELTDVEGTSVTSKAWPLSSAEARQVDNEIRKAGESWWLRNKTGSTSGKTYIACVNADGTILDGTVENGIVSESGSWPNMSIGVRPAFHLKKDAILFCSPASGGKVSGTVGKDALTKVADYSGNEWKMTIINYPPDNYVKWPFTANISGGGNSATVKPGDTVKINYNRALFYANQAYLSALITDTNGEVLYYGNVYAVPASGSYGSNIEITIPQALPEGSYTLKIFNEQCYGDNRTDFATPFSDIALTVKLPDTTKPTLTAGAVRRDSDGMASVKFTSNEAGQYYYSVVDKGQPEPVISTTTAGQNCDTAEQTISLNNLTVGAKDIYIVVKDAANNVSDKLKIEIPAYAPAVYGVNINPSNDYTFPSVGKGYSNIAGHTVTVTNTGTSSTGDISLTLSGTGKDSFTLNKPSIASLTINGSDSFAITPKDGLAPGLYEATVTVKGMNIAEKNFKIAFTVKDYSQLPSGNTVLTENLNTSSAATVYFGNNSGNPYRWQVIGSDGSGAVSAVGKLTFLAKDKIASSAFNPTNSNNYYAGSILKGKMESIAGTMTTEERNAMPLRTLDGIAGSAVSDAALWPLSISEANQVNLMLRNISEVWWLRSAGTGGSTYVAAVKADGGIYEEGATVDMSVAVRPAFQMNMDSILFPSSAVGGKISGAAGADALTQVEGLTGNEWKLTIKDSSRSSFSAQLSTGSLASVTAGGTIEIDYNNAKVGSNEYVSAIIADSSNNALYYGNIVKTGVSTDANGSNKKLTIPGSLSTGNYILKIFNEQCNGDKKTDYASAFIEIPLSITTDNDKPKLTAVSATRESQSNATVAFTSNENGQYYYEVVDKGASAQPVIPTSGAGTACYKGNETHIALNNLSVGAKDIYIVVKDASGNVSDKFKMEIPDFILPGIKLNPSQDHIFADAEVGYTNISAYSVAVINTGSGTIPQANISLQGDNSDSFVLSATSISNINQNGVSFTVSPKPGLPVGNYKTAVFVSSGSLEGKFFKVYFNVLNHSTMPAGNSALNNNKNTSAAATVYFGADGNTCYGWKVIGFDGAGAVASSGKITLLAAGKLGDSIYADHKNYYNGSNLKQAIDTLAGKLTAEEQSAIFQRDLDSISGEPVTDAVMWPLSYQEARTVAIDLRKIGPDWYLRSPLSSALHYVSVVRGQTGLVVTDSTSDSGNPVWNSSGVRPALQINLDSILFCTQATGGKVSGSVGLNALSKVNGSTGNEWKLTLKDNSRSSFSAQLSDGSSSASVVAGNSVKVNYQNAKTGITEYISAMITDTSGKALYYGNIANNSASRTEQPITIPAELTAGSYTLKIFNEQCNGDKKTDYASNFVEIPLTVTTAGNVKPILTAGAVNRTSIANATVKFTSDKAGQYYYQVVDAGATEPVIDTTGTGTSCDTAEQTIALNSLTAGAKDVYIVVKDTANTVSEKLKITIHAQAEHSITVQNDGNGTASADKSAAAKDTQITLDASANSGYHFKEWQVISPATLTITGNTFSMPDENVTVKAIFEKDAPPIVNADINPSEVSFKLDAPADVNTTITWNSATAVTAVKNGMTALNPSTYSVSGNTMIIKESYLSGLDMNVGDEINLTISFDKGNEATLKVTAVKNHTPSTDASLSDLRVGNTTVTGFAVNKYTYSVELPQGTQPGSEAAKVTATAQDAKATLEITQATQLPGTAKVKVTAEDTSSSQEYTINFTIQTASNHTPKRKAAVSAETTENVEVNSPYSLDLSEIFEDEDDDELTYKVSVDNAATVTAETNYSYTPTAAGTTKLVFTANDGKADSADTYTVTLTATESVDPDIASVNAAKDAIQDGTVKVGIGATQDDKTAAVQSYVNNIISNTANAAGVTAIVTYSSGDQYNVALSKGSVNDNKSLTMTIVEVAPITVNSMSIKTSPPKTTYTAGEKLNLAGLVVTLHQDASTSEDIAFEDFAGSGITVSPANGTVLTTTDTEVTITHTASGKSVKENITVNPASSVIRVTGITVNPKSITLYSNTTSSSAILATTIAPSDATEKGVSWQSSNPAVATVDAAGKVSAVSNGIATITATTADGGYTDSCMVTVTTYNSGTSSGGGGGSGGSMTVPKTNITTDKQPDMPTVANMSVSGTVKDGILSATITEQMVKDAIKAAQDAAEKSGKTLDGIAVDFNVIGSGSYTNLNATIDAGAIDRLKELGVKFIKIGSSVLDVTLDTGAIAELDKQSTGTVTVSARKLTKLSDAAKALIGNRPVFDITVSYQKNGKTELVSKFGKGIVTLGIAYKATGNENKGNLFGVYIDKNGKPEFLKNSSYDNTGRLIFSRNSLSTYGVGYKAPSPAFIDTAKHWAKEHIDFVVSRGLITGSSESTFAPNTAITRADFLMALGRLSGADVSSYKTSSFTDVKNTDTAMPYIEWAVKNKIVSGYGNGKFGSTDSITREQMAVMMVNYAEATVYKLPVSRQSITFADDAKISAYAKAAVKAIQQTGVVGGKGNNLFDPQGNATRAEASTILRRFVELVIDEGTARGWVQNDAGQWQYIGENGKPAIGWLTADGGKYHYYFTADGSMVAGKWLEVEGKWYYFNADGSLAKSTKIDGYEVDENGVRKVK